MNISPSHLCIKGVQGNSYFLLNNYEDFYRNFNWAEQCYSSSSYPASPLNLPAGLACGIGSMLRVHLGGDTNEKQTKKIL